MEKLTDLQLEAMKWNEKSSEFKKEVVRIAKRLDISVNMITDKEVEFLEKDSEKANNFICELRKLKERVKIIELYRIGMHKDTYGYDTSKDKSLYQVDDDYYRRLVGEAVEDVIIEQVQEATQLSLI